MLLRLGRFYEATDIQKKVIEEMSQMYGKDDLELLTTKDNLVRITWKQGDFTEALKMGEEVVENQKRLLGERAPATPDAQYQHAFIMQKGGSFATAM